MIYAIVLGQMAIAAWGNASRAEGAASREAARLAGMYRDLEGYPEPVRATLRRMLGSYAHFVIEEAWPAQRRGEVPLGGTDIVNEFARGLYAFHPTTDEQRIAHGEALHAFNAFVEARRERLEAVDYAVPGALWAIVLMGAAIAITASYVFSTESFGVHATMTGLLAAMIALLVFFIATQDRPYRGAVKIDSSAYQLVLRDVIERAPNQPP